MYGIIYMALGPENMIYIGQTVRTLDQRMKQHIKDSKKYKHYFARALNKHGKEAFTWEVISECQTKEELKETETKFIEYYQSNKAEFGYNLTNGGEGTVGYKHSDIAKKKMSIAKKGKTHSKESKKNMSIAGKGRIFSEEHIKKLTIASQKRKIRGPHSEEHKKNISKSGKGLRKVSKLSQQQVYEIRKAVGTLKIIASQYEVSLATISMIKNRKLWQHLPEINPEPILAP